MPDWTTVEFKNEEGPGAGRAILRYAVDQGRLHGTIHGFLSAKQCGSYLQESIRVVGLIHRSGRAVRGIGDISKATVQRPDVALLLATATDGLYRGDDRFAVIVDSILPKIQVRRVIQSDFHQFFLNLTDAEVWLASGCGNG